MKRYLPLLACLFVVGLGCSGPDPDPSASVHDREDQPGYAPARPAEPASPARTGFDNFLRDLDTRDRAIWQKPEMVIALLGNLENKTVADIGAGTGYFAFRMVSKAKKVIATEIDPAMIAFMDSVRVGLPLRYQSHFETRLAQPDDPSLLPDETDAVIIVNTYGYIDNRVPYLQRLIQAITPGGKLLIIDYKKNNLRIGPPDQYKVAVRQVERELLESGFVVDKIDNESLDFQYIVLASRPSAR